MGNLRQTSWRARLAQCLPLAVLLVLATSANAQRYYPDDPVAGLREALRLDRDPGENEAALRFRDKNLKERATKIRSLGDLGRALLLQEWSYEQRDPAVVGVDRAVWNSLADRFKTGVKEVLRQGDPTTSRAVANLLAETAAVARGSGARTSDMQKLLSSLAPDLAATASSPSPQLREAAGRSLGRINPSPDDVIPTLAKLLKDPEVGVRRAAAGGLVSLIQVAFQLEQRRGSTDLPPEVLRKQFTNMAIAVIPVAAELLQRSEADSQVRLNAAEAIQQAAFGLSEMVNTPPNLIFPPRDRKEWTAEERRFAQLYKEEVEAEIKELEPLRKSLATVYQGLSRTLGDADPMVRMAAARALEDVAAARGKFLERVRSVPEIPPAKEAAEEKKEGRRLNEENGIRLVQGIVLPPPSPELAGGLRRAAEALGESLLRDPDVRVRLSAVDALELMGPDALPAARALGGALRDRDRFVRWASARTLGKLGPVELDIVLPGLIAMVCDPDLDLRLVSATTLEAYGEKAAEAAPALLKAVNRGDVEIRVRAIEALGRVGAPAGEVIPALVQALGHPDPRVRIAAARLLGMLKLSPEGKSAVVAALRGLLDDPREEVRRAASEAMLNLVGPM